MSTNYSFGRKVSGPLDDALLRVIDELRKEGFGVLSDIDVQATVKKKLGLDMAPYRILGACNPQLAHRALTFAPEIGVLLPCNVVVRQDDRGEVQVDFMDPNAVLDVVKRPEVTLLATEVRQRLQRVMEALT